MGAPVRDILFESGYSSAVFGVALSNDRNVVVKVRPWDERLLSCWRVHRALWEGGFPCPEPLGPTENVSGRAVSVEDYLPGGEKLPRGGDTASRLARVLAELVGSAPAPDTVGRLEPRLGFLRWDHPGSSLWPSARDAGGDLNEFNEPTWIDDYATLVRTKLTRTTLAVVVGHGDWWSENIRWQDGRVLAVDDWDSLVVLPEAAIVGVGAALFADGASTIEESEQFLDAYIHASGRRWSSEEMQVAWGSGLWARLFDARKNTTWGSTIPAELAGEVEARALRSGIDTTRERT